MSIYVLCVVVLLTAVPLTWWIKREGERSWVRHQALVRAARQREQMDRLNKAIIDFRVVLVDHFTPALQRASAAMSVMASALRGDGAS